MACVNADTLRLPGASNPRFITATVEHFADTGEWPSVRLLQNVLTELEDDSDARREAKRLRYGHGRREDGKVVLSVRGIFGVERNHPLLDDFESALRVANSLYRKGARRVEATISYRDLIGRLSFSELRARRAIALLASESLVTESPGKNESRVILPRIRFFLRVRDVGEYVKMRRRIDRRRRLKRLAGKPLAPLRWFAGKETKIRDKILVGVLTALLAAAALWGVGKLSAEDERGAGKSPPSRAQASPR